MKLETGLCSELESLYMTGAQKKKKKKSKFIFFLSPNLVGQSYACFFDSALFYCHFSNRKILANTISREPLEPGFLYLAYSLGFA